MNAFLLYVVQSTLCLSLFYGLYLLLLRREAFFRFNRGVLLVIMALSMVIPLIRVPVVEPVLPVIQKFNDSKIQIFQNSKIESFHESKIKSFSVSPPPEIFESQNGEVVCERSRTALNELSKVKHYPKHISNKIYNSMTYVFYFMIRLWITIENRDTIWIGSATMFSVWGLFPMTV